MAQNSRIERQVREALDADATEQAVATWLQPVIVGRINNAIWTASDQAWEPKQG